MQKIVAILGPTASGKTGLSIDLAKRIGAEIVSADSMQIYDRMNIGTAKPTREEMCGIPHHLMGHVSVEDSYNVVAYTNDAKKVLMELESRGIVPVICGGTGLYIDHLLSNTDFFDIPVTDQVRERLQKICNEKGSDYLYEQLKTIDPILSDKLHPNDTKRIIRGLEVFETTGKRLSEFQKESKREAEYRVLYIGLNYKNRDLLYERINKRVDLMVEAGLVEEVRKLMAENTLSDTARAAIGYKEIIDAICQGKSLDTAFELIKQKSRNYAKRQLTWFKRNSEIHWFYPDETDQKQLYDEAYGLVESFLKGDLDE